MRVIEGGKVAMFDAFEPDAPLSPAEIEAQRREIAVEASPVASEIAAREQRAREALEREQF